MVLHNQPLFQSTRMGVKDGHAMFWSQWKSDAASIQHLIVDPDVTCAIEVAGLMWRPLARFMWKDPALSERLATTHARQPTGQSPTRRFHRAALH